METTMKLKSCPFCGGQAKLVTSNVQSGYGGYGSNEIYHAVVCANCESRSKGYHQKHLISFTSHTVSDFRNNPILRAKVEDEYAVYCKQVIERATEAWNKRIGDSYEI